MNDIARLREYRRDGKSIDAAEPLTWRVHARVDKYHDLDLAIPFWHDRWERGLLVPDDYAEHEGNLLMTVGATDLFNGLVTSNGLGSGTGFYGSANTGIGVGDAVTAASAGQTDLQAAAGTKLNAADVTSASNATPIVVAGTYSPTPLVGQVVVCSAFSGAGAAAINNTFELSVASGSSITLLNSAGTGAITVTSALVKPINRYLQIINGAPVVSTNTAQFVSVFPTANANFIWNEWAVVLGQNATNKQATLTTHMYNRAVPASLGTKVSGSWTLTVTASLA